MINVPQRIFVVHLNGEIKSTSLNLQMMYNFGKQHLAKGITQKCCDYDKLEKGCYTLEINWTWMSISIRREKRTDRTFFQVFDESTDYVSREWATLHSSVVKEKAICHYKAM